MKKLRALLVVGTMFLVFSGALYAQGLNGGGYTGPSLEPITIADLADAKPNDHVIIAGILTQQRVPGKFILVEGEDEEQVSVVVWISSYEWVNLEIDGETEVWVYGTVLKSNQSIEILAERVALPAEEE